LTIVSMIFWICTFLGYALSDSHTPLFHFWAVHPGLLVTLFFLADLLLIASVVFAWKASGNGRWVLWIAAPIMAVASIILSFVLFLSVL
jgi:hypothetical protein